MRILTNAKKRREQRKRAVNRLRKKLASDPESDSGSPVVARADVIERRIRDKRRRKHQKTQPQTQIETSLLDDSESVLLDKRRTLEIVETAAREKWPVTPEMRETVVKVVGGIVSNELQPDKLRLAAARTLILADSVNAGREKTAQGNQAAVNVNIGILNAPQEEKQQRLAAIANRLGITAQLEASATEKRT